MHAEITSEGPGNRWDDRPVKTFRARRPQRWAVDVVKNSGMPLDSCALYILLIDLPERWELKQQWVVSQGYAKEKRVRRMFNDMIQAGRMRMARRQGDDGKLIPGIYEIADEPIWLDQRLLEAVDNLPEDQGCETAKTAPFGEAKVPQRRAPEGRVDIRNSIVDPITDTDRDDGKKPIAPQLNADGRDRGRKAPSTREAERRVGGAKADLPQTEPRKRAANGSPGKGRASGEAGQTPKDRNIERMRERMFDAAGPAMAQPRKAARLMSSLIQWLAQGYSSRGITSPARSAIAMAVRPRPNPRSASWKAGRRSPRHSAGGDDAAEIALHGPRL
jgi:hypothetical protein